MAPPTFTREVPEEEENIDTVEGPYARVLACAYVPDKTVPAFCCFLDGSGQVTDFLRLNHLLKRKYSSFDREREEKVRFFTGVDQASMICVWAHVTAECFITLVYVVCEC